ncbi:MAG: hypothetical protein WBD31_02110 [Rubripirellula sp.]
MNYSSRHKLNAHHLIGSIGIAAVFAVMTNSLLLFIIIAGTLIATAISSGDIRINNSGKR